MSETSYCTTQDKKGRTIYWRVSKNGKKTRAKKADALRHGATPCGTESVSRGPEAILEDMPAEIFEMISEEFSPKTRESLRATSKKVRERISKAAKPKYAWIVEIKKASQPKYEVFLNKHKAKEYFETIIGKKLDSSDLKRLEAGLGIIDYSRVVERITYSLYRGSIEF